ncbi:response regulator transcription factor [Limnochorda pilosa]|uniref:LuxR family transcriptional regulator n=1 Tax=Limnochorda pilosa TaxID=1555112 RepID=A0A0K2SGE4_LIMPI|nr:response regulator [Limnochorda pilosa]BAS26150.1 LuxR family transcriptional regulator [Limnochorda pilosa]
MRRVMVVTRRALLREGLKELLRGKDEIQVVDQAERVEEALEQVGRLEVDAVLVDCTDPKLDSVEVAARLLKAGSRSG